MIHPLWLAGTQTDHRREEIQRWAGGQLDRILAGWQPGAESASAYSQDLALMSSPGLQGTEMWLAITRYLADTLNHSDTLGLRPARRPQPDPYNGPRSPVILGEPEVAILRHAAV